MNCDQAIELLPWLLNGTLEADERREVLGHLGSCASCRAALADTRTAWEIFDSHPPAAALIAHAGGETAATGSGGDLAAHVAACPRCAADLELVRTSRLLAEDEDQRIAILARPAVKLPLPERRGEDAGAGRAWRRSALAASLVGLLAFTGWFESARHARSLEQRLLASRPPAAAGEAELRRRADETQAKLDSLTREKRQLQQRVDELGRSASELTQRGDQIAQMAAAPAPRVESTWMAELSPAEQTERGTAAAPPAAIPISSGAATLGLRTRHHGSYSDYEIEIRDAQDRLVGKPARVRPPQDGDAWLYITLRRGALAPGAYTIHLFGRPAGGREPLDTYSIRVS